MSFLFSTESIIFHFLDVPTEGHLCRFQVLPIMSISDINICVQVCFCFCFFGGDKFSTLLNKYQKYSYCIIQFKCVEFCKKSPNCLLKWLPFCIPISNEWEFLLLHIFASIWHFPNTSHFRNGMDLTEAEYIKKRWQEYTEELYKRDLHDP